jgi:hypothetical protein
VSTGHLQKSFIASTVDYNAHSLAQPDTCAAGGLTVSVLEPRLLAAELSWWARSRRCALSVVAVRLGHHLAHDGSACWVHSACGDSGLGWGGDVHGRTGRARKRAEAWSDASVQRSELVSQRAHLYRPAPRDVQLNKSAAVTVGTAVSDAIITQVHLT